MDGNRARLLTPVVREVTTVGEPGFALVGFPAPLYYPELLNFDVRHLAKDNFKLFKGRF